MSTENQIVTLPPPGLLSSISKGFEAIAHHIYIILLPIGLDVLLWLGPRLRIRDFMQPIIASWTDLVPEGNFTAEQVQQAQEVWEMALTRLNLFTLVRTFPVGMPSLVAGISPENTPLGRGLDWQVSSATELILAYILISLVGVLIGGVYLYLVARIALQNRQNQPAKSITWAVFQSYLVTPYWLVMIFIMLIPGALITILLTLINPLLTSLFILFVLIVFIPGLLAPMYFSPYGVFVYGKNALFSVIQSLTLIRYTLPVSGMFLILVLIISQGLGYLWRIPPETSWLLLVGIAGHAFVNTALVAGSFIYYRDMNAWLQVLLERLKNQMPTPPALA